MNLYISMLLELTKTMSSIGLKDRLDIYTDNENICTYIR